MRTQALVPAKAAWRRRFNRMASRFAVIPGIALCLVVAVAAKLLELVEQSLVGGAYLEALVLAILIGVAVRTAWTPGKAWRPGISFSAKFLLEVAVALLGASLSAATVLTLGPLLIISIAAVVAISIATSYLICRMLDLPVRMAILVACGNSICGNSAIAAVAPVIGATSAEISSAIAFTAVLGVVVVLTLPLFVPLLGLSLSQYGVLAGLTVYAVPQVLAATLPIGALSNQVGTIVKLVRVLMLGPVVFGLSLIGRDLRAAADFGNPAAKAPRLRFFEFVPWFILGFLLFAILRSLGLIPHALLHPIIVVASALTTLAMAALGLDVDIRSVAKSGPRVIAAVTISLIILGTISYGLIVLASIR